MLQPDKTLLSVTPENWAAIRTGLLDLLAREGYGFLPQDAITTTLTTTETITKCCSGHAELHMMEAVFTTAHGTHVCPMHYFMPKGEAGRRFPLILLLNFRSDPYDMYYPAEEIVDNGFALAVVNYENISSDDGDFKNGLAGILDRPDTPDAWGKISLWAFAASRILDRLLERHEIDADCVALAGHSRLGKTTLWCAANDERIRFACSSGAGCMGDALNAEKHDGSEHVSRILQNFPFWFCDNLMAHADDSPLPFDQHLLLAAIAPRFVAISSASEDTWADPVSQQYSCVLASTAWEKLGLSGYAGNETPLPVNTRIVGDPACHVGFQYRDGIHFLGRADWLHYMDFIRARI